MSAARVFILHPEDLLVNFDYNGKQAHNAVEAFHILENDQDFDKYLLENDLGSEEPKSQGVHILEWALNNNFINHYAAIKLLTWNPVARQRMIDLLEAEGFHYTIFHDWRKNVN